MQLDLDDQDDDDDNDQDIPGASVAARRLFAGGNVRDNNADHTARDADVVNSHRQSEMSEKSRMSEPENTDRRADARERDDGEQRRAASSARGASSARDASSSRDARSDIDGLGDRDERRSVHSLESHASIDLTSTDLVPSRRRQPGRRGAWVISSNRKLTRPPLSAR